MRVLAEAFRCDLCGAFRDLGVTEDHTEGEDTRSRVCWECVQVAHDSLEEHAVKANNTVIADLEGDD